MEVPSSLELRHAATDRVSVVAVPSRRVLVIEGTGPPNASDYEMATVALRGAFLAVADLLARAGLPASPRPAAETLWWPNSDVAADELVATFSDRRRWHWAQLLAVPDRATDQQVEDGIDANRRSAGRSRALVRLRELTEGDAVQMLALGGPTAESVAYARLLDHLSSIRRLQGGPVHLIHLTAPDLVPMERRRAIVRIPVAE